MASATENYKFALIPKNLNNPFFDVVREGCEDAAASLTNNSIKVECIFLGPDTEDEGDEATDQQIEILNQIIQNRTIQGVAIAANNAEKLTPIINATVDSGLPVITFDSDCPLSKRQVLVGTDNPLFGEMLAKVLLQIGKPVATSVSLETIREQKSKGFRKSYSILTSKQALNLQQRENGILERLDGTLWKLNEIIDGQGSMSTSLRKMHESMQKYPDQKAILPVGAWPMLNETGWCEFADMYPDVLTVVADALDVQIKLSKRMKVDALVGQLPFLMGKFAIDTLKEIVHDKKEITQDDVEPTKILQIITIPLLDEANPDRNYIGYLRIIPYVCYGIILTSIITCGLWTWKYRTCAVVRASQPIFLWLILAGTLIFSTALIPITFDDEIASIDGCTLACQTLFWFPSVGITIIFSALFSKAWRLNKIVKNSLQLRRVTVTVKDVIVPGIIMLALNMINLVTWTIQDPISYVRRPHEGTDQWNRILSTYGACTSKHGAIYISILFVTALLPMVLATIQYAQVRNIKTDFNESSYIAVVVLVYVQALLLCGPILSLIRTWPRSFVVVMSMMIFITTMATLVLIFIPKISYNRKQIREQRQANDRYNTSIIALRKRAGKKSKSEKILAFIEESMNGSPEVVKPLPIEKKTSIIPDRHEKDATKSLLPADNVAVTSEVSSEGDNYGSKFVDVGLNLNSYRSISSINSVVKEEQEDGREEVEEEQEDEKEELTK